MWVILLAGTIYLMLPTESRAASADSVGQEECASTSVVRY